MNAAKHSFGRYPRALLATLLVLTCATEAHSADSYNPANKQLTISTVIIGSASYSDVVIAVGSILSGPTGASPDGNQDTYNPSNGELTVQSVTVGSSHYFNVVVKVAGLISIGGVTGADSYSNADLTIASVQLLGGSTYNNVVISVGRIVGVAGGMPALSQDVYNSADGQLKIPAVQFGATVYTNVSITVGKILSVGAPPQISALSQTGAQPFSSLTITGTGFSGGTSAISVVFTPENGDPAVMIPVAASSATSIEVMVPTFNNLSSGAYSAETVDVQVVQFSPTATYLSNTIKALPVSNLPPVASGVPSGAMTGALLSAVINISATEQNQATGISNLSALSAALVQLSSDLSPLISAVNTITNNPTQTATLTAANGTTIILNAQMLAQSDQLAQALLAAIVTQGSIPIQSPSANCPAATGNTPFDSNLCSVQLYFQSYASNAAGTVAAHDSISDVRPAQSLTPPSAAILTLVANLVCESAAAASGGPVVAALYSLVGAPLVGTAIASFGVNQETPSGAAVVGEMGIYLLDQAVYFGIPVLSPYLALFQVAYAIDNYSPPSQKNILLSSGIATFMPGGVTFLDPNSNSPTTLLKVPDAPAGGAFDTTTLIVTPSSTLYTLTLSTSGSGSGSISSFPSGTTFPAGINVNLIPNPATGSIFTGWSGACSGTGSCVVTMNSDQAVTATFEQIEVLTGTGTWTMTFAGPSDTFLSETGCSPSMLNITSTSAPASISVNVLGHLETPGTYEAEVVPGSATVYFSFPQITCPDGGEAAQVLPSTLFGYLSGQNQFFYIASTGSTLTFTVYSYFDAGNYWANSATGNTGSVTVQAGTGIVGISGTINVTLNQNGIIQTENFAFSATEN